MYEDKYKKFLTILIVISVIAIVVLIGYFGYSFFKNKYDNKKAEEAVEAFKEQYLSGTYDSNDNKNTNNNLPVSNLAVNSSELIIPNLENNNENVSIIDENSGNNNSNNNNSNATNNSNKNTGTTKSNTNQNANSNTNIETSGKSSNNTNTTKTTSTIKYQGFTMLGTIEIPKINLKTPVLLEVSPKALSKATCLLYGSINEVGNTVIIGHNNRNGTFFSNLKKLVNGDKIVITDYTGEVVEYQVFDMFLTEPDDTSFYRRDTYGKREITLSTCTDSDDTQRTIVFAEEI